MSIGPTILEIQHFQNVTLKMKGQGQATMLLHNYRSRQFHRTPNCINPSSGFRDMVPQSLAQVLSDLTSFRPMDKPAWGKWANNYNVAQLQVSTSPWNSNGVNPSSSFRDMRSASLDPFCGRLDKSLAQGRAHMGQMDKWSWQCTITGQDNSTALRIEKIRQAVAEIWVPWRQYPSKLESWGVNCIFKCLSSMKSLVLCLKFHIRYFILGSNRQ